MHTTNDLRPVHDTNNTEDLDDVNLRGRVFMALSQAWDKLYLTPPLAVVESRLSGPHPNRLLHTPLKPVPLSVGPYLVKVKFMATGPPKGKNRWFCWSWTGPAMLYGVFSWEVGTFHQCKLYLLSWLHGDPVTSSHQGLHCNLAKGWWFHSQRRFTTWVYFSGCQDLIFNYCLPNRMNESLHT